MKVSVEIYGPTDGAGIKITSSSIPGCVCVWVHGAMTTVRADDLIVAAEKAQLRLSEPETAE